MLSAEMDARDLGMRKEESKERPFRESLSLPPKKRETLITVDESRHSIKDPVGPPIAEQICQVLYAFHEFVPVPGGPPIPHDSHRGGFTPSAFYTGHLSLLTL